MHSTLTFRYLERALIGGSDNVPDGQEDDGTTTDGTEQTSAKKGKGRAKKSTANEKDGESASARGRKGSSASARGRGGIAGSTHDRQTSSSERGPYALKTINA